MGLKVFVVLGLVLALTLTVLADNAIDDTKSDAVKEMYYDEDSLEPQQGGGLHCRYRCCHWGKYGCSRCCRSPEEANVVQPQKRGGGGCRHGCCGSYAYGQCSYCCPAKQAVGAEDPNVVQQQKRGRGGCKHGCCGSYAYGQCSYCCPAKQAKNENEANP